MNEFLKSNKIVSVAIGAIAAALAVWILLKLKNKIVAQQNEVESIFSNEELKRATEQNATITKARASQLCEQIKSAWGFLNDDEDAIYNVFKQLKNEWDLALLIQMYNYKGENLQQSITSRMSNSERRKINEILVNQGIEVTF